MQSPQGRRSENRPRGGDRGANRPAAARLPRGSPTLTLWSELQLFVPTEQLGIVQSTHLAHRTGVDLSLPSTSPSPWTCVMLRGEARAAIELAGAISTAVEEVDDCTLFLPVLPVRVVALGVWGEEMGACVRPHPPTRAHPHALPSTVPAQRPARQPVHDGTV